MGSGAGWDGWDRWVRRLLGAPPWEETTSSIRSGESGTQSGKTPHKSRTAGPALGYSPLPLEFQHALGVGLGGEGVVLVEGVPGSPSSVKSPPAVPMEGVINYFPEWGQLLAHPASLEWPSWGQASKKVERGRGEELARRLFQTHSHSHTVAQSLSKYP